MENNIESNIENNNENNIENNNENNKNSNTEFTVFLNNHENINMAFQTACIEDKLELAKWIYNLRSKKTNS